MAHAHEELSELRRAEWWLAAWREAAKQRGIHLGVRRRYKLRPKPLTRGARIVNHWLRAADRWWVVC